MAARRAADLTVAVGISGGVDSAIAAHLLVEQGYRVIGLHVRSWDERDETGQCSGEADRRDAEMVCAKLGIPLHDVRPPICPESAAINMFLIFATLVWCLLVNAARFGE